MYDENALCAHMNFSKKNQTHIKKKSNPNEVTYCVTKVEDVDVCLPRDTVQFHEKWVRKW